TVSTLRRKRSATSIASSNLSGFVALLTRRSYASSCGDPSGGDGRRRHWGSSARRSAAVQRSLLGDLERPCHAELGVTRNITDVLVPPGLLERDGEARGLATGDDLAGLDALEVEIVDSGALVDFLERVRDAVLVPRGLRELE